MVHYRVTTFAALLMFTCVSACDRTRSQAVSIGEQISGSEKSNTPEKTEVHDAATKEVDIPTASDEVFDVALNATVRVVGTHADGDKFTGSGVIVARQQEFIYVLTVWHAAREGVTAVELFSTSSWPKAKSLQDIEMLPPRERADLALLKVKLPDDVQCRTVKVSRADGSPLFGYSAGCSAGKPPTVLSERITGSKKIRVEDRNIQAKMWVSSNPQTLGRSGGPLLNVHGDLLGIALGKSSGTSEGKGFYCHSSEISDYLIDRNLEALVRWSKLGK